MIYKYKISIQLFLFFVIIGLSFNVANAQVMVVDQISDNKYQFDVQSLPILTCSCPTRFDNVRFLYFWRFGDGGYSKKKDPVYEYKVPGNYTVRLDILPTYTDEDPERIELSEALNLSDNNNWTTGFQNEYDYSTNSHVVIDQSVDAVVAGQQVTYVITFSNGFRPSTMVLTNFSEGFSLTEHEEFGYVEEDMSNVGYLDQDRSIGWSSTPDNNPNSRIFVSFQAPEPDELVPGESFSFELHNLSNLDDFSRNPAFAGVLSSIRASHDPNIKTVNYDYLTSPGTLEYYVDFQNYGDGATNQIKIKDEIHPLLDFDGLEILEIQIGTTVYNLTDPSSDPNLDPNLDPNSDFHYLIDLDTDDRYFEITMYNARLEGTGNPVYDDCANEYTTGYIKFSIPSIYFDETTLEEGTAISNQASVYFDSNDPIETETVHTEIDFGPSSCPDGSIVYDNYQYEFQTTNFIVTNMELESDAVVILNAGKRVDIVPGAIFHSGSVMLAKIEGCTSGGGNSSSKFEGVQAVREAAVEGLICYPNPFKDETKIEFNLEMDSNISLDVYSIEGKHIKNIINNEHRTKGQYAHQFAEKLNPGVYLVMLKTDTEQKTFKLLKSE